MSLAFWCFSSVVTSVVGGVKMSGQKSLILLEEGSEFHSLFHLKLCTSYHTQNMHIKACSKLPLGVIQMNKKRLIENGWM